jgi:hypothetical protein
VIGVDQCEFDELEHDPEVKDDEDETDMNDMVCALSGRCSMEVISSYGIDECMYMLLLIPVVVDDLTRSGAVWSN